ncbi:MAG TPA: heat-inducible transcriptional repressor HrcA [Clostridia bacterium]|nr:heat-inducible transcriptional repressor HrcA [Clostridia bacterium]
MLTSRQIEILKLIVDDFILTGSPVGSRRLSKIPHLKVSSATIRNEMADLEDYGYVIQPHISAGRIPSELGLRFYVDSLLSDEELPASTNSQIRSLYFMQYEESSNLLEQAARVLSHISEMTVLITVPEFSARRLTNMKLVKMSPSKVLLVLITDTEDVKTLILNSDDVSQKELDALNVEFSNLVLQHSLDEISLKDFTKIKSNHIHLSKLIDYILPALRDALSKLNKKNIIVSGRENLLRPGYFTDMDLARKALGMLKDPIAVLNIFDNSTRDLTVRIGAELGNETFSEFSFVQANYGYGGGQSGQIGLLGPKRMDYSKVISIVEVGAKTLTDLFSGIHL